MAKIPDPIEQTLCALRMMEEETYTWEGNYGGQ